MHMIAPYLNYSAYLSSCDRIVEAFEVIVASTVQNENFTEVLIEENDVALLAERVKLSSECCSVHTSSAS